jgi:hypothetical protein
MLLTRDPMNQRLLTIEIWKQLNAFLPTENRCNTPFEFCDHLGIRHIDYYNSSGRKTPCLYWCTNDEQYAKYITEALVPPGRSDVRSLTIFGDLDIHLALFTAKTDKTTKDAIFLECLKTSQQSQSLHQVDVTYLRDTLTADQLKTLTAHFQEMHCIIPFYSKNEHDTRTMTHKLVYTLNSKTCQYTEADTRGPIEAAFPGFTIQDKPTTSTPTPNPRVLPQTPGSPSRVIPIKQEDRSTFMRRYLATIKTKETNMADATKIYLVYNGKHG